MKDAELKKSMGWLSLGGYCIKCAIRDGWAKAEVCMNLPNKNSPGYVSGKSEFLKKSATICFC